LRFASLGSGSEGNGLLVEAQVGDTTVRVLVDCGFGRKDCLMRLGALGVDPASLSAILVTHEHSDHVGGVATLARHLGLPVYLTRGTAIASGLFAGVQKGPELRFIETQEGTATIELMGLQIEAVTVPHDAREPVQFVFDDGHSRLGVLTDLGHVSRHVEKAYQNLTALVLECNHDPAMLARSEYPAMLKRRISGDYGHLSNASAAQLLAGVDRSRLGVVVAAHLSRQNNTEDLARSTLAEAIGASSKEFWVADQDAGLEWLPAR
jgi:phosphoribosyl 1,2-cyclic phosphodiesterase